MSVPSSFASQDAISDPAQRLVDHISKQCAVSCTEAKDGDVLKAGYCYVALGDFHMLITKSSEIPTVHLVRDPAEHFCRPAVGPMLDSLVDLYGAVS